jgi:NADPH-dependent 2,4-dienoyl-CoA reductase/sulfur reductase-like enzyme
MKKYNYIVVGGGMSADAAVKGIREVDLTGKILMVSSENNTPYDRPPLSKSLWKGKSIESIWRNTEEQDVEIILGKRITSINPKEKTITDAKNSEYGYEKLLIATGAETRKLPYEPEGILYYRSIEDYKKLRSLAEKKNKFAVIGTGFIGSEISAALAMNNNDVTVIDIGAGIGWKIFPAEITEYLNNYFRERKVTVITNIEVTDIHQSSQSVQVKTSSGLEVDVDAVIAGVGVIPNTILAENANLEVGNGICVNEYLQTSNPDIFAAGDVANFYNPLLDQRIRIEHANNADSMGRQAGRNMAGAGEKFDYLPYFFSDLFDLGYEAVGLMDSRWEIVEDWQEKFKKGVLYYLEGNRVRGVILWNIWDKLDVAREIIGIPAPVYKADIIGKIK